MLIYIIIFIYCLTRKVLEEPKPQRSWDLSPHPRGCQTCSVIQRSSQRRDRTPCATPKLEPTDPSLSAAHGRQLGGALKFWTLLMNIENMLQNQTASLTMEHIYIDVLYIYIYTYYILICLCLVYWCFRHSKSSVLPKRYFTGDFRIQVYAGGAIGWDMGHGLRTSTWWASNESARA